MSHKNKKLFGVWMDTYNATIIGKENTEDESYIVLGTVENKGADNNSNEHAANNHEISLKQKFFKEIAMLMPNIDEIHITGTGQIQEQFTKFLADTPQYKNVMATNSTAEKMSDEQLVSFVENHFN